jgi:hypothetical protein
VGARYWRYIAVIGLIALFAFALYTTLSRRTAVSGVPAGQRLPPFAAPLALGGPNGDVNVATRPHQGSAGGRPACEVRGTGILNICQLYEQGPVVLALFLDGGSCPNVLRGLQRLAPSFPQVRFAAVAVKAQAKPIAQLVRKLGLGYPVGFDRDGVLGALYQMQGCAQVTFARPGGVVQGKPLLEQPSDALLRARIDSLLGVSRAAARAAAPGVQATA